MMERLPLLIIFVNIFFMVSISADEFLKSVFLFGDSLFDAGNNPYIEKCSAQANFPPYGSTFFGHPTGRFSNGRTVADLVAQLMGIEFQKPFQEVYKQLANGSLKDFPANGINFASAGSGVLSTTNKAAGVSSIQAQLQQLQTLMDENHLDKNRTSNSLFFLESGSNDIFNFFLSPNVLNLKDYVKSMLNEVTNYLDKIYELGARRIAIFSVGPMGCIPAKVLIPNANIDQCHDKMIDMVKIYNDGLEALVVSIPSKYPGAISVYGAVYNISEDIRANPKNHGFVNVNEACCGAGPLRGKMQCGLKGYELCSNPHEFFFWDFFHPTEHIYTILSEAFWTGGNTQIRPMNLKTLAKITD